MTLKIIHKNNTSAGQAPASSDLDIGEIAVNSADAELYTKDTNGNIRKFQNTTTGTADGLQFTQAGSGALQRTVESKLQDVVSVLDFIPPSEHAAIKAGTSTYDCAAAFQAAIDSLSTSNGAVIVPGTTKISSTITIKSGVVLDFQGYSLAPTGDFDVIKINPGGGLRNVRIACNAVPGYSSVAVTFSPTASNVQGDRFISPVKGLNVAFQNATLGSGIGLLIDGSTYYVQYVRFDDIAVRYGEAGIKLIGGVGALQYANGNMFTNYVNMDSYYALHCKGNVNGNMFNGVLFERNVNGRLYFEGSSLNNVTGIGWDQIEVLVDNGGVRNAVELINTTRYGTSLSQTESYDNSVRSTGATQKNNVSTNSLEDYRQDIYAPGRVEFREFFFNALQPQWSLTHTASNPTYGSDVFGDNLNNKQFYPFLRFSGNSSTSSTATIESAAKWIHPAQKPIVHGTIKTANGFEGWRLGLYGDANNYIYFEQNNVTYSGSNNIKLVVNQASVVTTLDFTAAIFERINFLTFRLDNNKVFASVAQYDNTATNATGAVSRGITGIFSSTEQSTSYTFSTGVAMTPYISWVALDPSSTGEVTLLDYQVIASRKTNL